jgi:hypothetical protein
MMGGDMFISRPSTRIRGPSEDTAQTPADRSGKREVRVPGSLGEEVADLYAAIAIAVPLALFLRWLWP